MAAFFRRVEGGGQAIKNGSGPGNPTEPIKALSEGAGGRFRTREVVLTSPPSTVSFRGMAPVPPRVATMDSAMGRRTDEAGRAFHAPETGSGR